MTVSVDTTKTGDQGSLFSTLAIQAGGVLAMAVGSTFNLYNTEDQTTNHERLRFDWSANVARIWTQNDGTGSERALRVGTVTSDGLTDPTVYTVWQGASVPYIDNIIPSSSSTSANGHIRFQSGNFSASSGTQTFLNIAPVFAQTGTAAGIAFLVNPSGTFGSAGGKIQSWQLASSEVAYINTPGSLIVAGVLRTATGLNFGSTLGASDLEVVRDAADALALRRGANAQTFRVYNTYTDASNYERGEVRWSANVFRIGTFNAGTGSARAVHIGPEGAADLLLMTSGTTRLTISSGGTMTPGSDNAVDFGSGANRLRNIYIGSGVMFSSVTVANLPASPVEGQRCFVTDSTATMTAGVGAVVAGGGANNVPVYYDGANWRIG